MDAVQESLNKMMDTFNLRLDTIEGQITKAAPGSPGSLVEEVASLKAFVLASMRALQCQIAVLALQVDQGEMRSRRKILLLHGLPETQKEETSAVVARAIVERLKLSSFTGSDISRCHRMGRTVTNDRPRPILFKLRDVALRDKIWSSKTSLKGSGVTLSEFLTKTRHDVFLAARQRFGISNSWTRDGCVYVLGQDGARHRLNCLSDLEVIAPKGAAKPTAAPKGAVSKDIAPKEAAGAGPLKARRAVASKK